MPTRRNGCANTYIGKVGHHETPYALPENKVCLCVHRFLEVGLQDVLRKRENCGFGWKVKERTVWMIPVDATKQK